MPETEPPSNQLDIQAVTKLVQESGIYRLLGMEILKVEPGYARLRVRFREALTHPGGVAHGGVMASLADSCIACALFGLVETPVQLRLSTVEMKLNYFRPFREGEMIAEGKIIQKGNTIAVGEMDIHDGKGVSYGKGLATYRL